MSLFFRRAMRAWLAMWMQQIDRRFTLVVNPYAASVAPNPFDPKPSPGTATTGQDSAFEQQLSTAIADSLRRLGVSPGEINISIRNSSTPSAGAQILISYGAATAATASPGAVSARTTPASPSTTVEPDMRWAPWDGPHDKRDVLPTGGGNLTATGAPSIKLNDSPAGNQYNYTGPAARNPYFTTPSNPLRQGYVLGFQNWFMQPFVLGGDSGPVPANKLMYSTEEGAQEALRIVQQFEPDATVDQGTWSGGPFASSLPMYYISLPGQRLISAGGILANYYNHGEGVTTQSDDMLQRTLRLA